MVIDARRMCDGKLRCAPRGIEGQLWINMRGEAGVMQCDAI